MSRNLNWQFIMPNTVLCELKEGGIASPLSLLLETTVSIDSCNDNQISMIKSKVLGLDDGELEAICIVDQCEDRTFRNYLILTDDGPAQKKAGKLGMNSLDVLMFLLVANEQNLLSKKEAINSLEILEKNDYFIDEYVKHDYLNRLN